MQEETKGMTRTRASALLLDEAMREEEFGGIEFRNTSVGRQAFVKGTGMTVWELIMVARDLDIERTVEHLERPVSGRTGMRLGAGEDADSLTTRCGSRSRLLINARRLKATAQASYHPGRQTMAGRRPPSPTASLKRRMARTRWLTSLTCSSSCRTLSQDRQR
jgi:hypothetical protein